MEELRVGEGERKGGANSLRHTSCSAGMLFRWDYFIMQVMNRPFDSA